MKEFILVEFLISSADYTSTMEFLGSNFGDDFDIIKSDYEYDSDEAGQNGWLRVSGKMNSSTASIIKLKYPDLANKMRVSYIPDELKDKYRR